MSPRCAAVGELITCLVVAILYWPGFDRSHWREYPDQLVPVIALLLELAAIAGLVRAAIALFT